MTRRQRERGGRGRQTDRETAVTYLDAGVAKLGVFVFQVPQNDTTRFEAYQQLYTTYIYTYTYMHKAYTPTNRTTRYYGHPPR